MWFWDGAGGTKFGNTQVFSERCCFHTHTSPSHTFWGIFAPSKVPKVTHKAWTLKQLFLLCLLLL